MGEGYDDILFCYLHKYRRPCWMCRAMNPEKKVDLELENRRMRWLLSVVICPGKECTLLDEYLSMDERYWLDMGL